MIICDRCIHNNVCKAEGILEEELTRCRDFLGWTPVSEGLPIDEENDYYLCCDKDGYITIGWISKRSKEWCFEDDEVDIDVVAWMPLPKPYKPKESKEEE